MTSLRIRYSCLRFPPARGGVEIYVKTMADEMHRRGHDVGVETSDFSQHLVGMRHRLPRPISEEMVYPVRRSRWFSIPGLRAYPFSPGTVPRLVRGRPDLIHAHCFYYWSADGAALASLLGSSALVLSPSLPPRETRQWRLYRRLIAPLANHAHVTTVLSEFERRLLARAGLRPHNVVPLPPSVPIIQDRPPWLLDRDIDPRRHQVLLFVGRVTDAKGVDTLIEAVPLIVASCPEARLCVAGPTARADAHRYRALADALGVGEFVHLLGEVNAGVRQSLYAHASVFLFPSRYEAFGIVALEAMGAGVPVVVADGSALPEVVGFGERGVVHQVGDPASLAAAAVRLLDDPEYAQALRTRGRDHVRQYHSQQSHGDRLEEIYDLALRGARRDASRRAGPGRAT